MMLSKYAPMVYAAIRANHFGSWKDALTARALAHEDIYLLPLMGRRLDHLGNSAASRTKAPISAPRRG